MKSITVETCEGVGDSFWTYQKLAPYFDQINFVIASTRTNSIIGQRAVPWLKLLPKAGTVTMKHVSGPDYDRIANHTPPLTPLLGQPAIRYAANKALEDGIRLEAIDPTLQVQWDVPVAEEAWEVPYQRFLLVYVSGDKENSDVWSMVNWAKLINGLANQPVILIGASYDENNLTDLHDLLKPQSVLFIDLPPAQVIHLMKKTDLFIGYQSGLNIFADNLGTRQVMLYRPWLKKLATAWPKQDHIGTIYRHFFFTQTPDEILNTLT